MFDGFTADARAAVGIAAVLVKRRGATEMDSRDLLLGLAVHKDSGAWRALTALGVTAARIDPGLPAVLAATRDAPPPIGDVPLGPSVRAVFAGLSALLVQSQCFAVHSGHLLLAIAEQSQGPGAAALAAAGVSAQAVRDQVVPLLPDGPEFALPQSWEELPAPAHLPGRSTPVAVITAAVLWYCLVGAAITALAAGSTRLPLAVFLGAMLPLAPLLALALRARKLARRLRILENRHPRATPLPPPLAAVAAGRGLSRVEIRVDRSSRRSFNMRLGEGGVVVIALAAAVSPAQWRFVVPHEMAHLLRNDQLSGQVCVTLLVPLVVGGAESGSAAAALVALGGALLQQLTARWSAELACDRLAVRWSGPAPLTAWADATRTRRRLGRDRLLRWRLRRLLLGPLIHPPLWLREAVSGGNHG
jgi:Zn-dependent protease with chaperone function